MAFYAPQGIFPLKSFSLFLNRVFFFKNLKFILKCTKFIFHSYDLKICKNLFKKEKKLPLVYCFPRHFMPIFEGKCHYPMRYERKLRVLPKCLHCGEKILYGRTDKRYCCEECRMEHHNEQMKDSRTFRRRVLSQLSANYSLLSTVLNSGVDSIPLADIVAMGFVPGIVTSYSRVGKHDEFGCFDIKYRMTATKLSSIIKIQNVSLNLHADSDSE